MARVIGRLPLDKAEMAVILALKDQLPPECVVVPGVRWSVRQSPYVREGEADAVVLWPGKGLLVLEVKGSREIRVGDHGWERKDRDTWVLLDRDPVEQATSNAHQLVRILKEENSWGGAFPGCFGWIAIYPNGEASEVPALFDATTLATYRDMAALAPKLRAALEARGPAPLREGFTDAIRDVCANILSSANFRIVPADGADDVEDDLDAIETLTRQQSAALQGLFALTSVAVTGPAGSGKTILAIWRLEATVAAGQRGIYFCYNTRLAEALRLRHPSLAEHIQSVDSFFGRLCPRLPMDPDKNSFFRSTLPNAAYDVISGWSDADKYDTVIIDETQDFGEDRILALSALKKDSGAWAMFMDKQQDLYQGGTDDQFADVTYRLSHNCRNVTKINDATNRYVGGTVPSMPGMPEGVSVVVEKVGRAQMANRAMQIASNWKSGKDVSVAIIGPFARANSALANTRLGHGLEISEDLGSLRGSNTVYYSTVKSFKGIEADCIILVDAMHPSQENPAFQLEDLYVACTRAKTRLAILSASQDVVDRYTSG